MLGKLKRQTFATYFNVFLTRNIHVSTIVDEWSTCRKDTPDVLSDKVARCTICPTLWLGTRLWLAVAMPIVIEHTFVNPYHCACDNLRRIKEVGGRRNDSAGCSEAIQPNGKEPRGRRRCGIVNIVRASE